MTHTRRKNFPNGSKPPEIIDKIFEIFERAEDINYKKENSKEYTSNSILGKLHYQLTEIGFDVESKAEIGREGAKAKKAKRIKNK